MTTFGDDPDPHGKRVLYFGTRNTELPDTVFLGYGDDGRIHFRVRSGPVRTLPPGEWHELVDAELALGFSTVAAKERAGRETARGTR